MYQGVKDFIASYRETFNREKVSVKKAKDRLREQGISYSTKKGKEQLEDEVQKVLQEWQQKSEWGIQAHKKIQEEGLKRYEDSVLEEYIKSEGDILPHLALDINKVEPGKRYYEKRIIDPINGLIGYIDELYIDKKWNICINEYKTSSNLNRNYSYIKNGIAFSNYYFEPIPNIIDCNFNHAALQASLYMYIVWYYNKKLKPGIINIKHIILDEDTGSINEIKDYEAPYMIEEIKQLLKHRKKNGLLI